VSYASVTATLALVFSMTGGAFAASHYLITSTKQIKPSVLSQLKGNAGAPGQQGPQGPAGSAGAQGSQGNQGATGIGIDALFGDGSDGNVTISSNTSLTRDMYYDNLTIDGSVTLNPNGYRIFVSGTLTLDNGAIIARNGNPGTSSGGFGAGLAAGTLGVGGVGAGDEDTPNNVSNSLGGSGGGGYNGSSGYNAGASATAVPAADGGSGVFRSAIQAISGYSLNGQQVNGGAGGTGGPNTFNSTTTYGSGSGGGVVMIAANTIVLESGSASIDANGGAGIDGAGSGGGGVVVVITTSSQPSGLTLSAAGGTISGAEGSPAESGEAGSPGFTDWLS
jgi:hypothetical protein